MNIPKNDVKGPIVKADIIISGKVQGVWYRAYTKKQAVAAGITGCVMNKNDGTVAASLEGKKENIEQLLKKLKKGPPFASVKDIQIKWGKCSARSGRFEIRGTE